MIKTVIKIWDCTWNDVGEFFIEKTEGDYIGVFSTIEKAKKEAYKRWGHEIQFHYHREFPYSKAL